MVQRFLIVISPLMLYDYSFRRHFLLYYLFIVHNKTTLDCIVFNVNAHVILEKNTMTCYFIVNNNYENTFIYK